MDDTERIDRLNDLSKNFLKVLEEDLAYFEDFPKLALEPPEFPMSAENAKPTKKGTRKYPLRIPLPIKPEKAHSTRKGEKGYNRKKHKRQPEDLMNEGLGSFMDNDG